MITADEYQQQCAKFDNHHPRFAQHALVMGLCAEVGEVANAYERSLRKTAGPFDFENLKLELGDTMWNVARLAAAHGWTLSEVMQANIDKLTARYAALNIPTTSIEEVSSHGGQTPSSAMVPEGGPGEG